MVRPKIVIVDDEEAMVQLLTIELEFEGYEVFSAPNGRDGLRLIRETVPDLVILDIMMPDMSGYEIIGQLKNESPFQDIPIIMLTAKCQDEDIQKGLDAGADDYVTKPFHAGLLLKRIGTVLKNGS